ncbi:MAG TPA: serine/threonine-protein kinase, partial [Archangium sp.]
QPFLVMEFLKGTSLALRARDRTMDLPQVSNVMRQVGAALQAAHRAGVVHRDLKPENIFLVPTAAGDQVKVLDFGISKLSDSNTVQTTDSVLIGTPLYKSPEQALGQNSEVSAQSDLFSLGSIVYELFTGQAPFVADNIAKVVFRIAYEKHAPLGSLRPDLPRTAVEAVEHALEKDRSRRTPDIDTFVHELTGVALEKVNEDETSGVYRPGMAVTPSLDSGATRTPSAQPVPPVQAPPPSPMDGAKTVSGKKVILTIMGAALAIALVVGKVRTDNWKERSVYRAGMIDAGYTLLADGTFDMDAGRKTVVDAGTIVEDAGAIAVVEVPDAGEALDAGTPAAVVVKPKVLDTPPTAAETTLLAKYAELEKQKQWERILDGRIPLRANLRTPSAREQGLHMLVIAACARGENTKLSPMVGEYKAVATGAQVKALKQKCIAFYPSAEFIDGW